MCGIGVVIHRCAHGEPGHPPGASPSAPGEAAAAGSEPISDGLSASGCSCAACLNPEDDRALVHALRRRGPDFLSLCSLEVPAFDGASSGHDPVSTCPGTRIDFIGSVLQLRGEEPSPQPLRDDQGNVLLFNGEIFGGLQVGPMQSDAQALLEALRCCCSCPGSTCTCAGSTCLCQCRGKGCSGELHSKIEYDWEVTPLWKEKCNGDITPLRKEECSGHVTPLRKQECSGNGSSLRGTNEREGAERVCKHSQTVPRLLSRIRGPWALVYWQRASGVLWYGRDLLGRRSLLKKEWQCKRGGHHTILASCTPYEDTHAELSHPTGVGEAHETAAQHTPWEEVTCGIFSVSLADGVDLAGDCGRSSARGSEVDWPMGDSWRLAGGCGVSSTRGAAGVGPMEDREHLALSCGVSSRRGEEPCSTALQHREHPWEDELVLKLKGWRRLGQEQNVGGSRDTDATAHVEASAYESEASRLKDVEQASAASSGLEASAALRLKDVLSESVRKRVRLASRQWMRHVTTAERDTLQSLSASKQESLPSLSAAKQESLPSLSPSESESIEGHLCAGNDSAGFQQGGDEDGLVGVLFSGGLDSMLLAALADQHVPPHCPIELLNVSFAGADAPDRITALQGLKELQHVAPGRAWHLIEVNASLADVDRHKGRLMSLIHPLHTHMDLNIGAALWLAAGGKGELVRASSQRVNAKDTADANGTADSKGTADAKGAPAAKGTGAVSEKCRGCDALGLEHIYTAKDKEARARVDAEGTSSAREWCRECDAGGPEHVYTAEDGEARAPAKANSTAGLPAGSEECGNCEADPDHMRTVEDVEARARVLLVGAGADEQCGGYARYRTKFKSGGWQALEAEMQGDMRRLWTRNLGRDDRCIADRGREARFPFLDEDVMAFLLQLPLDEIVDLRLPQGQGDKKILRQLALLLGLPGCAALPKRAIQFGSRVAKESNIRHFGSNRAANMRNVGELSLT